MKNDLENVIVKSFTKHFNDNNIDAVAFRYPQNKYVSQKIDVLVDSKDPKYYLAVECKSIKTNKIYFNSHFTDGQIESENKFIKLSGRTGYLALEKRFGPGKSKELYLIPWELVYDRYKLFKETGLKKYNGFSYEECKTLGKKLKREGGFYYL